MISSNGRRIAGSLPPVSTIATQRQTDWVVMASGGQPRFMVASVLLLAIVAVVFVDGVAQDLEVFWDTLRGLVPSFVNSPLLYVAAVLLALLFCLIPGIIALKRQAKNRKGIMWLSILSGFTVVGWVAAFIWACTDEANTWSLIGGKMTPAGSDHPLPAGRSRLCGHRPPLQLKRQLLGCVDLDRSRMRIKGATAMQALFLIVLGIVGQTAGKPAEEYDKDASLSGLGPFTLKVRLNSDDPVTTAQLQSDVETRLRSVGIEAEKSSDMQILVVTVNVMPMEFGKGLVSFAYYVDVEYLSPAMLRTGRPALVSIWRTGNLGYAGKTVANEGIRDAVKVEVGAFANAWLKTHPVKPAAPKKPATKP